MNTIRSTWIGWGALCVAGGGAYYFAKQAVNSDRASRHEARQQRKLADARMEAEARQRTASASSSSTNKPPMPVPPASTTRTPASQGVVDAARRVRFDSSTSEDDAGSPSEEAGHDPAPTRHEPDTDSKEVAEKGKYEASEPFRPRRGNRFS